MDRDKLIGVALLAVVFLLFFTQMKNKKEAAKNEAPKTQTTQSMAAPGSGSFSALSTIEGYTGDSVSSVSNNLLKISFDQQLGDISGVPATKS